MFKEKCLDLGLGLTPGYFENDPRVIIGIDCNFGTVSRNPSVTNRRVIPVCADVASLPFKEEAFQTVTARHVLEHLAPGQEQRALSEAGRVLKQGGILQAAVPHPNYEYVMGKIISKYHSPDMHQQIFSRERLEKTMEQCGLILKSSTTRNWLQAVKLVTVGLIHRQFPNRVDFKPQIGFDIQKDLLPKGVNRTAKKIINKILNIPLVNGIMDKIFPFEIYIEAVK